MDAAGYDAWYRTPRGAWIGNIEFELLRRQLRPESGESLLDVGCGTGHFTRRFAALGNLSVIGLDPNPSWLDFANSNRAGSEQYCVGSAETLPFPDRYFDLSISVAALCFVEDARQAIRELLRITRRRFAIGLLNRYSLLYLQKGRDGGSGAYRGAHWHTAREIKSLFDGLAATNLTLSSAVHFPNGSRFGRAVEPLIPSELLFGAFIVAAGGVREAKQTTANPSRPVV